MIANELGLQQKPVLKCGLAYLADNITYPQKTLQQ